MGQFEDIETFVRIVEAGSISRAANQLGVVKSAVSRRLNDLETRLGVQLLARTTRTSSLTEAGQQYYTRARQILGDVAEINAQTGETDSRLSGTLKVSAPLNLGTRHLFPIVTDFSDQNPDLAIQMDFNDRQVDLVNEGYDLAIRIAILKDSSMKARKLFDISMLLCASPNYLKAHGTPETIPDLRLHKALHYGNANSRTWTLRAASGQKTAVHLKTKMVSNNGDFLSHAAIAGHGVILTPSFIVWDALKAGQLVPIMPAYEIEPITAYAVYPGTRHLPQRVRRFIETLRDRLKDQPYWQVPKAFTVPPLPE